MLNVPLSRTVRRTRHNAKHRTRQRGDVQREEEDEGVVVVVPRCGDDCGGDEGSDEGRGLPHDGEEGEEEEPRVKARHSIMAEETPAKQSRLHLGQRGDLADHGLTVGIPWADHQAVVGLVQPDF